MEQLEARQPRKENARDALRTAGEAIGSKLGVRPVQKLPNRVKLLVSIVNARDEVRLKEVIDECSVSLSLSFSGTCTAHSQVLDYLGIEKERTRVEWVSAAEGAKFAATMNEFVAAVTKLGENKRLEDLRCKK